MLSENIDKATEILDAGFEICTKKDSWDIISKVFDACVENAENAFHEEFVVRYSLKLIGIFPDKAILYDTMAYALSTLNEQDKAIEYGKKAVALAPDNSYFLNNLGMYYLTVKCFDDAVKCFNLSIKANPEHVNPKTNLADCKLMKEKNVSSKEYYLRHADYGKIQKFKTDDEISELHEYVDRINSVKYLVFRESLSEKNQFKVQKFRSLLNTLTLFFDFVETVSSDIFVWEDVDYFQQYFKKIIHKFIFKHGDVDDEILTEIFDSTRMYYRFLSDNSVIEQKQFNALEKHTASLKDELFEKMHKYNKVRHDPAVSEKKKQKIREELFENDHDWIFLD